MNKFAVSDWRGAGMVLAAILAGPVVFAGEPIQFSREKPRPATAPEEKLLLPRKGEERISRVSPTPGDFAPAMPVRRERDPRDDRRRRNAEAERKNWMLYDRGELQEKDDDEAAFGIRDYSLEKDDGTAGGFFVRKDDDARNPGRSRLPSSLIKPSTLSKLPGQNSRDAQARTKSPEPSEKPADRRTSPTEDKPGDHVEKAPTGEHLSKDLDLRGLLSSGDSQADGLPDARANGKDGGGALAARWRDESTRRDGPSAIVFGTGTGGPQSGGLASSLGRPSEPSTRSFGNTALAASPSAPGVTPGPSTSRDRGSSGAALNPSAFPTAPAPPGLGRTPNPYSLTPPALSDPYYSRSASPALGAPQGPLGAPPAQSSPASRSGFSTFSIPRK